ncbi:f-box domain-containing protein [Fusarium heterosporum]|uniref:F-box domain-containing protein n=1 Tax=Fusarium heterosporum TaxID=42747 RepID=A0A8H5TSY6_FUSHE|nr:f-box domain-containing protein [Fusarium heterosporum]
MKWHFKFVNLDKVEHFAEKDCPDGGEVIMTGDKLVSLLRKPIWVNFEIAPIHYLAAKQKSPESRLISMPSELLDKVFKNLKDNGDGDALVCLALTNSYFFRVLAKDLQKILLADAGKWGGDRVVFAGTLAAGIPSDVRTSEEEAEWWSKKHHTLADIDTKEIIPAGGNFKSPLIPMGPTELFNAPGDVLIRAKATMTKEIDIPALELLERLLSLLMQEPNLSDEQKKPVLRNLITKQFIRGEGCFGNMNREASLGEALLPFIWFVGDQAWTPARDLWFGHRFDISPAVTVDSPEWTDITSEATEDIKFFYMSRILWRSSLDEFTIINLPTNFSIRMQELDDARARGDSDEDNLDGAVVNNVAVANTVSVINHVASVSNVAAVNDLPVVINGTTVNVDAGDGNEVDGDEFDDEFEFEDFSEDEDDDGDIILIQQN